MQGNNDITIIIFVKYLIVLKNNGFCNCTKYKGEIPDIADFVDFQGHRHDGLSRSFVYGLIGRLTRGNLHNVRNIRLPVIAIRIVDVVLLHLRALFVTRVW
ncbi:MAG: hypothetical protein ACI9MU_003287 [Alphaproteobacteria bacterium]|jgi:hypothetical protein